ncbi:A24 family peptidase [Brevundimonas sp. SORGH_AS_0993]|uniref:prepilin peptidase n=1 Tax=Brevundimonas sp. SORGH_AS_0993 TaxID=3041794 RepID=UPI002781CECD|nr:A24 family peptidase [Brevundimonas sp. SORGH_AS_0993]MDQ1153705.1 leader peptidase (prepilin peptidase)/N-methyltransferase [Brevundimonas sp. SORGH_AS_0993]
MNSLINSVALGGLGLIVGSFLAALSVRLPLDEDIVSAPSRCRGCERRLRPWERVPVFSWLVLRGRCARCGTRVSPRYPLIEFGAAAIGVWAAVWGAWAGVSIFLMAATALLGWQLLLIALLDGEHFWLPDRLTLPLIGTGLAVALAQGWTVALSNLVGAVAGFAGLWLVGWLYRAARKRQGLGGGDPILFAGAGAWVGWIGLPSVLLWACAAALGLVFGLLAVRRSIQATTKLPFGVFLAVGVWLTWLYGPLAL